MDRFGLRCEKIYFEPLQKKIGKNRKFSKVTQFLW